ncbi:hypothetical protein P170DRAFT_420728 [Aspergillus steynii IBT 23096]|uniref:Uncharacterized protein n=1 Tax=Aspergillus steynii IBT 23096 TaxID=1392250 RepID=A0A2I2GM32_9EURO|nr:uncharacterized protein P170DRAFT_420728 [Aspergillus steynii IBT 23096]PLB53938.1 hypothetical protein P170DRAFT_420728 [Aspergillus steynii IBT 23096]
MTRAPCYHICFFEMDQDLVRTSTNLTILPLVFIMGVFVGSIAVPSIRVFRYMLGKAWSGDKKAMIKTSGDVLTEGLGDQITDYFTRLIVRQYPEDRFDHETVCWYARPFLEGVIQVLRAHTSSGVQSKAQVSVSNRVEFHKAANHQRDRHMLFQISFDGIPKQRVGDDKDVLDNGSAPTACLLAGSEIPIVDGDGTTLSKWSLPKLAGLPKDPFAPDAPLKKGDLWSGFLAKLLRQVDCVMKLAEKKDVRLVVKLVIGQNDIVKKLDPEMNTSSQQKNDM